jgi:hypothetical protein
MTKYILNSKQELVDLSREYLIKQIGVKEATGHNDGDVVKYLNCIGLGKGNAYCLAGQVWCFEQAAKDLNLTNPLPKVAKCSLLWSIVQKKALQVYNKPPEVNDLIIWVDKATTKGHTERIIEVLGSTQVVTVGFNTSNGLQGSQREGDGVFKRIRTLGKLATMDFKGLIGFAEIE